MTIDRDKLREAAKAATSGVWDSAVWHGSNEDSWTATGPIHTFGDDPYEPFDPESETAKRAARDSAFIAAATPQAIIELLDEIENLETALVLTKSSREFNRTKYLEAREQLSRRTRRASNRKR